jgi:hypothetical protein
VVWQIQPSELVQAVQRPQIAIADANVVQCENLQVAEPCEGGQRVKQMFYIDFP